MSMQVKVNACAVLSAIITTETESIHLNDHSDVWEQGSTFDTPCQTSVSLIFFFFLSLPLLDDNI